MSPLTIGGSRTTQRARLRGRVCPSRPATCAASARRCCRFLLRLDTLRRGGARRDAAWRSTSPASSWRSSRRCWSRRRSATGLDVGVAFHQTKDIVALRLPGHRCCCSRARACTPTAASGRASRGSSARCSRSPSSRCCSRSSTATLLQLLHLLRLAVLRAALHPSFRCGYERVTGVILRAAGYRRRAVLVGSGKTSRPSPTRSTTGTRRSTWSASSR